MAEELKPMRFVEVQGGVKRIYANAIRVAQNEHDVRLMFGEMIHVGEELATEERVVVTVAWTELKSMVGFIQRYINAFESQNGPLKTPTIVAVDNDPCLPISAQPNKLLN